jgi:hypothetical protein
MPHNRFRVGFLVTLCACCPMWAHAQIVNPSFESPGILPGSFGTPAAGWNSGQLWFPAAGFFTTPVPDGNQVAFNNGASSSVTQTLASSLTVGQTNLTVAFGQRLDGATGTSQLQLYAGNTLVASKTIVPGVDLVSGKWTDETIGYTALIGDPLLGSPLTVSALLLSGTQVDVDNFRLTNSRSPSTPEPGAFALLFGSGISGGLFVRRRTRKKTVSPM